MSDAKPTDAQLDPLTVIKTAQAAIAEEKATIRAEIDTLEKAAPPSEAQGGDNHLKNQIELRLRRLTQLTKWAYSYEKLRTDFVKLERIAQGQGSEVNLALIFERLNRPEERKKWSQYMQKMNLAAEIVRKEWSQEMKFDDGTYDKVFLSPEGVLEDAE